MRGAIPPFSNPWRGAQLKKKRSTETTLPFPLLVYCYINLPPESKIKTGLIQRP